MNIKFELFKVALSLEEQSSFKTAKFSLISEFKSMIKSIVNRVRKTKVPIKELTEEEKMVSENGYKIKNIKNPSKELQLMAVKNRGTAIQFIKNPDEEVQIEALNKDPLALYYIDEPTKNVQKIIDEIIKKKGWDEKDKQYDFDRQDKYLYQSILNLAH